jgi:hypothetical protein
LAKHRFASRQTWCVKQEAFRKASDCNSMSCLLLGPNLSGSDQVRIRTRHQIQR